MPQDLNKFDRCLKQLYMFVSIFIIRFEHYLGKETDIADGKVKPKYSKIFKIAEKFLNHFFKPYGLGTLVALANDLYKGYIKQNAKKVGKLFPEDITEIRYQLYAFAFEIFRSYECVLMKADDKYSDEAIICEYREFIDATIERIFHYFQKNKSQISRKEIYNNAFMNGFLQMKTSREKDVLMFNSIGIVTIDDKTNKHQFFRQKDTEITQHYRLLTSVENEQDLTQSNELLGVQYVQESNDRECEYILNNYTSTDFSAIFEVNINQNQEGSFKIFGLPRETDLYIHRIKPLVDTMKALNHGNTVVILGLKGCGKTELAINIGIEMKNTNNVYWIDGSSKLTIEKSFERHYNETFNRTMDEKDDIVNIANRIYSNAPNLVIFDNVESLTDVKKYLPDLIRNDKKSKILITSTSEDWHDEKYRPKKINLDIMNDSEAIELFLTHTDSLRNNFRYESPYRDLSDGDKDSLISSIKKLFEDISKHPLVIRQSSAYIFSQFKILRLESSEPWQAIMCRVIESFVKDYKNKEETKEELMKFEFKPEKDWGYNKSIYATISLMIEKFKSKDQSVIGKVALNIFNIMTYFEHSSIPATVFKSCCEQKGKRPVEILSDAVDLLVEKLLIKRSANGVYMEELVQIVNKVHVEKQCEIKTTSNDEIPTSDALTKDIKEELLVQALKCLRQYLPNGKRDVKDKETEKQINIDKMKRFNNVLPHIISVWSHACEYQNICKQFLLDNKNNQLLRTTHFHIIAQYSEVSVMKKIVEHLMAEDADKLKEIYQKENTNWYRTPLHCAAGGGNLAMVQLLMDLFTNVDLIQNINERILAKKQLSPLHLATRGGHEKVVDYLIEKGHRIECYSRYGFTPAHIASANGYVDILEMFVNKDEAIVNKHRTDYGFTLLHLACQKNHLSCVKFLLQRGADCKAVTKYEKTALHLAADRGHENIVDVLLSWGNDKEISEVIKMKDTVKDTSEDHGSTALHWAAFSGHHTIVEKLLKKERSIIDGVTGKGNTALHLAVIRRHIEVIKILIKYNARKDIKNEKGEIPGDLADDEKVKTALKGENIVKNIFKGLMS